MINTVTRGRLNKMCKYFKGKKVNIQYLYNNSLNHFQERNYTGTYDSFNIKEEIYNYGDRYFIVNFFKNNKRIFEQHFGNWSEFYGLGKIRENNSGPYCFFTISFVHTKLMRKIYSIFKQ